jgi:cytochrome c oxidase cbb3-type subunit III
VKHAIAAMALAALLAAACDREARRFVKPLVTPDPRAQAGANASLQPGEPGPGLKATAAAGGYAENNAYEVSQGKRWFRWYNCSGCHAQGGGGMGPALMDDQWIYGAKPDDVFSTIMNGRPNGMPSFRGRIPEAQAWQLVAYVRSLSGLIPKEAATNRADTLSGGPPENRRKPQPPDEEKKK